VALIPGWLRKSNKSKAVFLYSLKKEGLVEMSDRVVVFMNVLAPVPVTISEDTLVICLAFTLKSMTSEESVNVCCQYKL